MCYPLTDATSPHCLQVKFEAFKEGFVAVLSESVEDLDVTSSDEDDGSVALGDASGQFYYIL